MTSRNDDVLSCCGEQEFMRDGTLVKEKDFTLIFGGIFKEING